LLDEGWFNVILSRIREVDEMVEKRKKVESRSAGVPPGQRQQYAPGASDDQAGADQQRRPNRPRKSPGADATGKGASACGTQ
jgi:hypothetical protein